MSGKMINSITEETGAQISIEDDGTVFVGAANVASAQAATDKFNAIANPQLPKFGESAHRNRGQDNRFRCVR
jgi:polyribonucleotide nucleotidyltransferase